MREIRVNVHDISSKYEFTKTKDNFMAFDKFKKGIVCFKPVLVEFLSSAEHKGRDPIDFHSIFFFFYCKSMGSINCWLTEIFLCVQPKKENHTGLKQFEGE